MMLKVISAICILWVVGVSGAARSTQLKPYNAKCTTRFPVSETRNCRPVKYFYNSKSGICEPTCQQDAPFSARNDCALTCRSTLVCFVRTQRQRCHGRPRFIVFHFNVYKRKCYAKKGCSYNGNNFPTLQECMNTCGAGAGSIKGSGGDEEGGSSSEHQVRQQAALSQLPVLTPENLARTFRPELPSIGKHPRSLQLPKEKPLLRGVPPTFPELSPAPPTNKKIQPEVQLRDPRCAVRISNTTSSCNTFKLYFDQNTHLCKATCSKLAPFESRSECNSICRSAVVCFDKRQPEPCKTNAKGIAFYFDVLKGKCYARSGCSYRGNNFPTIQECKNTCNPYAGYGGATKVINASAFGLSNITPSQPVNKEAALAPSIVQGVDKKPPVAEQGAGLSTTAGLVRTTNAVMSPSVSDAAIMPLISHKDPMCLISHLKFASSNCTHHYYYFHQASRLCKPTCSEMALFAARSACDKICRSAVVCFHHIQEEDCESRHKATVFSFDAKKGRCITKTGCSNEGNNFPTLQECVLTCAAYTGFQRLIHIGAPKLNASTTKGPPKLLPPKQHTAEELPNRGLVLNVSGNVPAVSSDTRLTPVQPHQDPRCTITVTNAELISCQTYMYYFDSQTHLCNPTCSNWAPFRSRRECVGICRSVLVCFVKRTQSMCSGDRNISVYYYDPRKGRCIAGKSCTYVGNNFPSLDECRRTCGAFTGLEEPGEEESSKVLPEISTKPTKEQSKDPETEQKQSTTTPAPTPPETGTPSRRAVSTPHPKVAGVHKRPQADSGIAPSPMPSQQHPILNQPISPMVPPFLPQAPTQQPATRPQMNPPVKSPVQSFVHRPQLSLHTESPFQDQAMQTQSSVPNIIMPTPKQQPPTAVWPAMQQHIKQQEPKINVHFSTTEQLPMQQVNTTVPAQPPSSTHWERNISPPASQHQQQSLQGPIAPQPLTPILQLMTQQTSSEETQSGQNKKLLPLRPQVLPEMVQQTTEQRPSTTIVSTKQLIIEQQRAPNPTIANQYWTVPQDITTQMFPILPGPPPYAFR